jgi:hypothetical protein
MGHIQYDNGTLVIGTRGSWLIADPGYQQYLPGAERDFTIGPTAHNVPLINDAVQTLKQPRRIALETVRRGLYHLAIDLTACYGPSSPLKTLQRQVWLSGNNLVVVADRIETPTAPRATYHWHGHPDGAWWFDSKWAMIALDGTQLWFTCSQADLSGAALQRLPGSRGQLSLVSTLDAAGPVVWWAFALGSQRPVLEVRSDGRQIRLLDQEFCV